MNKKIVRKLILEEVEKKLLNEMWQLYALGAAIVAGLGAAGYRWVQNSWGTFDESQKLESTLTCKSSKNLYDNLERAIQSAESDGVDMGLPDNQRTKTLVTRMRNATFRPGVFGQIDMGTDNAEVRNVILACKSKLGLAKVAMAFCNEYAGLDLYETLLAELNQSDEERFLVNPWDSLPFAIINGQEVNEDDDIFRFNYEDIEQRVREENQEPSNDSAVPSVASTDETEEQPSEEDNEEDTEDENKTREECVVRTRFEAPYVKNIAMAMNEYNEKNNIGRSPWQDDKECPVDDNWSDEMQNFWLGYILHVFSNEEGCDLFNEYGFTRAELSDWTQISRMLVNDYPRYTRNPKGCLAFVLDTICCKIVYGMQQPDRSTPARSTPARSTPGRTTTRPDVSIPSAPDSGRRQGSSRITIKLGQGQNNFTNTGFSHNSGENPDTYLKKLIKGFLDRRASASGVRPGTMQFYMYLDENNNKVNRTDTIRTGRDLIDLKPTRKRELERQISDFGKGLVFPTSNQYNLDRINQTFDRGRGRRGRNKPAIFVTVTFTGGRL